MDRVRAENFPKENFPRENRENGEKRNPFTFVFRVKILKGNFRKISLGKIGKKKHFHVKITNDFIKLFWRLPQNFPEVF